MEQGQRVVTTGPYAIVRHPMYLGVLVMFLFTPVELGSWWAVISALPLLAEGLKGYREYTQITRYRLIPGVG